MTISLTKGQSLSLAKNNPGLTRVFMGLGWDAAKPAASGGFFGRIFGGGTSGGESIDLDASVIVFDASLNEVDTVSFRKLKSSDGAIKHDGDNLTGDGDGDDEVIHVDLSRLNPAAAHLVFTVNSFRGQTFNEVDNAVARLVDESTGREICSFMLKEQGAHTGVVMASLSKGADGWTMKAHGKPASGRTVQDLVGVSKSVI
jgi:tellurium resistance protein TerZ